MPAKKKIPSPVASGRSPSLTSKAPAATPLSAPQTSTPTAPSPVPDPHTAWQQAHDSLQQAFEQGNRSLDLTEDETQRSLLNKLLDTLSDELTALNQEEIEGRTISLAAASQELGGGIEDLRDLKQQIQQISDKIAQGAEVVSAINSALGGIATLLATFPAI